MGVVEIHKTIFECGITVIIMFSMRITQVIVLDGSGGSTNTIKVREASHDSNVN
jgi:hypothetical protein